MLEGVNRVYCNARVLGYQRGKHVQHPNFSLIQIENVNSNKETRFYMGKRVAYVYRAKKPINGTTTRVIWGKIVRPHGNSGVVRAKFRRNLPSTAFGQPARVMLYPSNI